MLAFRCKVYEDKRSSAGTPGVQRIAAFDQQRLLVADRSNVSLVSFGNDGEGNPPTAVGSVYDLEDKGVFPLATAPSFKKLLPGHAYASDRSIQSVFASVGDKSDGWKYTAGSMDDTGCGRISRLDESLVVQSTWTLSPSTSCIPGLHTLLHNPYTTSMTTTVSSSKTVRVYDGEKLVRESTTVHSPSTACYLPSEVFQAESREPLLAVAERGQFSIWDPTRTWERGGCVARQQVCAGNLLALAPGKKQLLTSGQDRVVYTISPRNWKNSGSWSGALKYEVGTVMESAVSEEILFAASHSDSEFAAGTWSKNSKQPSRMAAASRLNGDGRWLGVCRAPGTDSIFGLTAMGTLYGFHNAFEGAITLQKKPVVNHHAIKRAKLEQAST
eukprot:m.77364 g.77364  ORF g.77364 m.77364 type:complete len:386 (+) comp25006_c0_seq1:325-1482(+)